MILYVCIYKYMTDFHRPIAVRLVLDGGIDLQDDSHHIGAGTTPLGGAIRRNCETAIRVGTGARFRVQINLECGEGRFVERLLCED